MENKKILYYGIPIAIFLSGLMIALAVYFALIGQSNNDSSLKNQKGQAVVSEEVKKEILKLSPDDHFQGNKNGKIILVEYSDLQCPFCKSFHEPLKELMKRYPNDILWIYRHFPISSIHPEAIPAAEASECVWEQKGDEGFWQFIDSVFKNQEKMEKNLYKEIAEKIGVDLKKFEDCVEFRKYKDKIENHLSQGIALGVDGTPFSFINGYPLVGYLSYESLEKVVQNFLK